MRDDWRIVYYFGHVKCERAVINLVRRIHILLGVNGIFVELPLLASPRNKNKTTNSSAFDTTNDLSVFEKFFLYVLIGICASSATDFCRIFNRNSCLPYGHLAYQLSIVCVQFIMMSNIKIICWLSLVDLIVGSYVTCLVLLSPTPPLQKSMVGVGLIILPWRGHISSSKTLFNIAIISLILLNFTDRFKAYNSCQLLSE
ncbi:hypothetical protein P5V15_003875 [Pogonomyrmex californicus]